MNRCREVPVITLDGPGGAGKGTLGRALAGRFGWHYLDSGALYRVVALAALDAGLSAARADRVARLIPALNIDFRGQGVYLSGRDVNGAIRSEKVGVMASAVAARPGVREALKQRQRAFRKAPGLVADGRDMGTVVFPDALLKVFLTASPEERARRRYKQLKEQGIDVKLPRLERELRARDAKDSNRGVAPLKAARDAVMLDTDGHSAAWALEQVAVRASQAANRHGISLGPDP